MHDPAAASVDVQAFAVISNWLAPEPPSTAETVPVAAPPVLVTVKSCVDDVKPATTVPNGWLVGAIVSSPGRRAVADSDAITVPPCVAVTVTEPVGVPAPVGVTVTWTLQLALGASVAEQPPATS